MNSTHQSCADIQRFFSPILVTICSGIAMGCGGCGPHRAALARGGKGAKNAENLKKSRENSDCKFRMCLRARKTKRYGQRVPIVSYYAGSLAASGSNFLSSFKNLRRKGGKFDHRPGRGWPKVLLCH